MPRKYTPAYLKKMRNEGYSLSEKPSRLGTARAVIAAVVALIGIPGSLVFYMPRPTLAISNPSDPTNSFSATLTVSNAGTFPLRHVTVDTVLGYMGGDIEPLQETEFGTALRFTPWQDHTLESDEKHDIPIAEAFSGEAGYCDIEIVVGYQPWFLPFRRSKTFRIKTHRDLGSTNHYHWNFVPLPNT